MRVRAAVLERTGADLVIEELELADPRPHEVLEDAVLELPALSIPRMERREEVGRGIELMRSGEALRVVLDLGQGQTFRSDPLATTNGGSGRKARPSEGGA